MSEQAADVTHGPGKPRTAPGQQFNAGKPHVFVPGKGGDCAVCGQAPGGAHLSAATAADGRKSDGPHGSADYADPGYQKDGKKRYPVSSADQVRSAWSYINQPANARRYTPVQREQIKSRIKAAAKKFGVNIEAEAAAVLQRLSTQYGPRVDAVGAAPVPAPAPAAGPSPRDVETQMIAENAKTPAAQGPHPFMAAEFPDDQGDARCRLCGQGTDPHAAFEPQIPVAAAVTSVPEATTVTLAWNGGITDGMPTISSSGGTTWTLTPRPAEPEPTDAPATPVLREGERLLPPATAKAFLTEVEGHTLLTAPANVFTHEVEKAAANNKHMLWMQGRFVGAEKPNRNGAFWSTADLELGNLTVPHGPLNWLHESRHVIGTIAKTSMVGREMAADKALDQPYIEAASAIWRWIYPDEAWVVEQASDAQKLWYSMECVSEEVACVGADGCGARASYGEYLKGEGATCAHMRQRSATRHFANPTFLGGAVIVPPVRPGWAEADATVLREAAGYAEQAFEQAGQPDVAASEWEQLMAQIVSYARRG